MDQHKDDACDMRPVTCEHCKRFFKFKGMAEHVALKCKSVLVRCRGRGASRASTASSAPAAVVVQGGEAKVAVDDIKHEDAKEEKDDKGCGARVKRGSMKRHWRVECPRSPPLTVVID
jgi:hypothetical protein